MQQLQISFGAQLRDIGMRKATDHANAVHEDWSDKAFYFLKWFVTRQHVEFMAEDVREAAKNYVPEPPSKRAWGAVIVRAKKEGLIKSIGFRSVSNSKAHRTPASLWIKS